MGLQPQPGTEIRVQRRIAKRLGSKSRNVNVTYDHNLYFGGKAPETKGPHDIIADPKFTAPGKSPDADFRLTKSSPAIGSATPFPAVSTDFTGMTRKGGASDRGAYSLGAATSGGGTSAQETPNASAGEPSDNTDAGSSADAGATSGSGGAPGGDSSDLTAHGGSEPLAQTGSSNPVLPLGIPAGVLIVGAGLLVLTRRKRS